jgi:hypothetical protein
MAATALASWPQLRTQLEKKATFEAAVRQCTAAVRGTPLPGALAADATFRATLARCFVLLRSRYTAPAFWAAARELFSAAEAAAAAAHDGPLQEQLAAYLAACQEHLDADPDGAEPPGAANAAGGAVPPLAAQAAAAGFLFEGQLSGDARPAPAGAGPDALSMLLGTAGLLRQQAGGGGNPEGTESAEMDEATREALERGAAPCVGCRVPAPARCLHARLCPLAAPQSWTPLRCG